MSLAFLTTSSEGFAIHATSSLSEEDTSIGRTNLPALGVKEATMSRVYLRCIVVFAVCQLVLFSDKALAQTEWDPDSYAISGGSVAVSYVYRPYRVSDCYRIRSLQGVDLRGWRSPLDVRKPGAFDFEIGLAEIDEATSSGDDADVTYASAGFRYYFLEFGRENRFQFFAGAGLGYYDVDGVDADDFGSSVKLGASIGLTPKKYRNHWSFEIDMMHHRLVSGLDFVDTRIGFRWHRRSRPGLQAVDRALVLSADTVGHLDLAANDEHAAAEQNAEIDLDLSTIALTRPLHGEVELVGEGRMLQYTPGPGYAGPDELCYRICDTEDRCDTAKIRVLVLPGENRPAE